jgi:hypothetical protein
MPVPHIFATATGNLALSELDENFATIPEYAITANTVIGSEQANITSLGTLELLNVTGNVTAGNILGTNLTGIVLTSSQTHITSVGTLGSLSVSGNVNGGNLIVGGAIDAEGDIATSTGGVTALGDITTTGNVIGGGLITSGNVSAAGNISGGNISITGSSTIGLTLSVAGNISGGNLNTGNISGGNINSGNISTSSITATGNINVGKHVTAGQYLLNQFEDGVLSGELVFDIAAGEYRTWTLDGDVLMGFSNWPESGKVGKVTFEMIVPDYNTYTITLPGTVDVQSAWGTVGYDAGNNTFTPPASADQETYILHFSSSDNGQTVLFTTDSPVLTAYNPRRYTLTAATGAINLGVTYSYYDPSPSTSGTYTLGAGVPGQVIVIGTVGPQLTVNSTHFPGSITGFSLTQLGTSITFAWSQVTGVGAWMPIARMELTPGAGITVLT